MSARHAGSRQADTGRGNRRRSRSRNLPLTPCSRTVRQAPAMPRPPPDTTRSCASKGGGWAVSAAARSGSRAAADIRATSRSRPSSPGTGRTPALAMPSTRCDAAAAARGVSGRSADSLDRCRRLPCGISPGLWAKARSDCAVAARREGGRGNARTPPSVGDRPPLRRHDRERPGCGRRKAWNPGTKVDVHPEATASVGRFRSRALLDVGQAPVRSADLHGFLPGGVVHDPDVR